MKKKKLLFSIIASIMLVLTTACVDYPEIYGYAAVFGNSEATLIEYTPSRYKIQLKATTTFLDEGAGISGYGFLVEEYKESDTNEVIDINVTPHQDSDGNIQLTTTFQGEFGKCYRFKPYATDGRGVQSGATNEFSYEKSNFTPLAETFNCRFDDKGQIVVIIQYSKSPLTHPLIEASVTYGDVNLPTTITDNSTVTAVIDLSKLGNGKSYSGINISSKNDMGISKQYGEFSITVPNTSVASYPDDGEKDDCIRLCGIDWAKGNLTHAGRKYSIASNQWARGGSYKCNSKISEEGNFVHTDWCGNLKEAAWMSPSLYDANLLLTTASSFPCHVRCADGTSVYGYLYTSPKGKRLIADDWIEIAEELVDEMGLFLPYGDFDDNGRNNDFYLLGSYDCEKFDYSLAYSRLVFEFTSIYKIEEYLYWPNNGDILNWNEEYPGRDNAYFIRPVKTPSLAGKSFFWYSYGGSDVSWYKKEVRYTFSDSEQCERHEWFYYSRDGVDEYTRSYTYTLKGNVVVLNDYNKTTLYLLKDYKGDIFLSSQGCESPLSNIYYEQE